MTSDADTSIDSSGSHYDDWDRSLVLNDSEISTPATPRNSVVFPGSSTTTPNMRNANGCTSSHCSTTRDKRSLSELLRLHAEKGTDVNFSQEEATRLAEVLGRWINASSSPYEAEDDFFSRSQDDLDLPTKKSSKDYRPRGKSESVSSRSGSSTEYTQS